MFHCIRQCYSDKLWEVNECSPSIPKGMAKYFKQGNPPAPEKQDTIVALSQFARPAFEVNPDGPIAISQYGKPNPPVKKK